MFTYTEESMVGRRFGKLVVASQAEPDRARNVRRWQCRCDCGNATIVVTRDLGHTKSCGKCKRSAVAISAIDAAWVAGLFDGEGCICIVQQKKKENRSRWFELAVSLSNTHLQSLERLMRLFGFGRIYRCRASETRRPHYKWGLSTCQAESFLLTVLPYLFIKHRQAELALEFRGLGQRKPYQVVPPEIYDRMCQIADEMRTLNGNTYLKEMVKPVPGHYTTPAAARHGAFETN